MQLGRKRARVKKSRHMKRTASLLAGSVLYFIFFLRNKAIPGHAEWRKRTFVAHGPVGLPAGKRVPDGCSELRYFGCDRDVPDPLSSKEMLQGIAKAGTKYISFNE